MSIAVIDKDNKKVSEISLDAGLQDKVNKAVLYYAIKAARNNLRHGTAAVKVDRNDINATNKKIYRQKGTGGARHASRSANIFVGGNSAHGPRPRSYFESLNKKAKVAGYRETFKHLIQNQALKVFDKIEFDKVSTKNAAALLKKIGLTKVLVILPQENTKARLSFRNLKDVKVISELNLSLLDMLRYENVIVTAPFFEALKVRYVL